MQPTRTIRVADLGRYELEKMNLINDNLVFLREDEGGRPCMPVGTGYAPHFVPEGTEEYLAVRFLDVPEAALQGSHFEVSVQLIYDSVDYSNLSKGVQIQIREGGNTVGTGEIISDQYQSNSYQSGAPYFSPARGSKFGGLERSPQTDA